MNEYYSSLYQKNRTSLTKGEDEAFLYKSFENNKNLIKGNNDSNSKYNNRKIIVKTNSLIF